MEMLFTESDTGEILWKEAVRFTIPGRAQQRGSKKSSLIPKRGGGFVEKNGRPLLATRDDNEKSTLWMAEVKAAAFKAWEGRKLLDCPIALGAEFYFLRPSSHYGTGKNHGQIKASAPMFHAQSPDLAKLFRALEDGISKIIWADDKLVCDYLPPSGRRWTTGSECTVVRIMVPNDFEVPQPEAF